MDFDSDFGSGLGSGFGSGFGFGFGSGFSSTFASDFLPSSSSSFVVDFAALGRPRFFAVGLVVCFVFCFSVDWVFEFCFLVALSPVCVSCCPVFCSIFFFLALFVSVCWSALRLLVCFVFDEVVVLVFFCFFVNVSSSVVSSELPSSSFVFFALLLFSPALFFPLLRLAPVCEVLGVSSLALPFKLGNALLNFRISAYSSTIPSKSAHYLATIHSIIIRIILYIVTHCIIW